jgi:hypothetical protein
MKLLEEYRSHTDTLEVPADCLPMIVGTIALLKRSHYCFLKYFTVSNINCILHIVVGKKGAKVNQMREEFPDVLIDIEGTSIILQSTNLQSRNAVRMNIEQVVAANYTQVIAIESEFSILLKGS